MLGGTEMGLLSCKHDFKLYKYSNIIQLNPGDITPKMLCKFKCEKCYQEEERWMNVDKSVLGNPSFVQILWYK